VSRFRSSQPLLQHNCANFGFGALASEACYVGEIMTRFVVTLAMLIVVMPAAAAPIPAVKSAQCPPGHMQSGGYCTPLLRTPPAAIPKLKQCPSGYAPSGNGCIDIRRR
jgi:uncharacterized membrane protein YtjA (UPF0391 family)